MVTQVTMQALWRKQKRMFSENPESTQRMQNREGYGQHLSIEKVMDNIYLSLHIHIKIKILLVHD